MEKRTGLKQNRIKQVAVAGMLLMFLTGCTPASTIEGKPFDVDGAWHYSTLMNADFSGYEFQFQDDINGQLMTQEVWQNGVCTAANVLWCSGVDSDAKSEYYLAAVQMRDAENNHIGQELQGIKSNEDAQQAVHGALVPVQNMFPVPADAYGKAFLDSRQKVEAGGTYILALWDIGQNNIGFKPLDLDKMQNTDYAEQIKESDYVILLKLQLFATEEEALAAGEHFE